MGENRNTYRVWWGKFKESHLGDLDIDGRRTLKMYGMAWIRLAEDREKW